MINNFKELRQFILAVYPYEYEMLIAEKTLITKAYHAVMYGFVQKYPITEKKILGMLTDRKRIMQINKIGDKTADYMVEKATDYLSSMTLEERMSIDREDEDYDRLLKDSTFKAGDIVLYKRLYSEHYEIGVVKRPCTDGTGDCFVWYHQGDTAARTPFSCLRKIENLYAFDIRRIRVDEGEDEEEDSNAD